MLQGLGMRRAALRSVERVSKAMPGEERAKQEVHVNHSLGHSARQAEGHRVMQPRGHATPSNTLTQNPRCPSQ